MKFESEKLSYKDEIEMMHLNYQMQQNQIHNSHTFGFNADELYHFMENTPNHEN